MSRNTFVCNNVEFKVGDKVRVMREVETGDSNGMGEGQSWENSWEEGMTLCLGLEFEIENIYRDIGAEFKGGSYIFPLAALMKV